VKFAVIGAGGVGGYFGGKLAQSGADVTFIARGKTLEALRTNGLRVDSINGDFALPNVKATDDPASAGEVDVVLLAVKAPQIPEVLGTIKPMIGRDTAVIPLENGMEAPEQIANAVGREHAMGGLCAIVSFIVAPGHIRHAASDPFLMFGELDNAQSERVLRIADVMKSAGIDAQIPPDIHRSMWTKFLFIAPMSGFGAVTRVPVGAWRAVPELRELARAGIEEIIALARARGVQLSPNAIDETFARFDGLAPDATSSLQRDIMQGKPSELDAQLGAVVRMGKESGVATPVCEFLYAVLLPQYIISRQ
jgi:2-dehydropantoate 2-reductase